MKFDYVRMRITKQRVRKGLRKADMAHRLGMEERNYERIESLGSGRHKHLDLELLDSIAEAMEIDIWQLVLPDEIASVVQRAQQPIHKP